MLVRFVITMEDIIVNDQSIDGLIISWQQSVCQIKILELSHQWITSQNFLTSRMIGLQKVGESSLTIEPMEDIPDFNIPL